MTLASIPNQHEQCVRVSEIPSSGIVDVGYYCLQRVLTKNHLLACKKGFLYLHKLLMRLVRFNFGEKM